MKAGLSGIISILIFILIVLLALILVATSAGARLSRAQVSRAQASRAQASRAQASRAQAGRAQASRAQAVGGRDDGPPPRDTPHHLHGVGLALHDYARALTPEHIVGTHPLDRDGYEPLAQAEPRLGGGQRGKPRKRWDEYETWEELRADEAATAAYFEQRAAVLENPDIDWGPILADMGPKLKENREHIGIASLAADGRTLRLVASEASPLKAGEMESDLEFAGVPADLVAKYASRPGLFLFHTHPADPQGSPLPSSHDLSTAIYFSATSRFAACAVISRYGVLVHGLDWSGYKAINEAKDWKLALLNLSHDVVAAHEAMRSWSEYTIANYLSFYSRHRLLMFVYPSPEMVGDSRRYTCIWDLETPIDHDLIAEHTKDIEEHTKDAKDAVAKHRRDSATRRNKITAKRSHSEKKPITESKAAAFATEQILAPLGFD
jgi:hypothetical protein